ncbi:hypothetical protein MAR_038066 [Mya arenaria]|uniref:Uncharacterized protein n=1 Tax=Mya arenaria TaxID=6604 RepID=A0ABY7FQH6_MYAAR|nr:hypothetical protein MAR_038066 [Mya arenaria]
MGAHMLYLYHICCPALPRSRTRPLVRQCSVPWQRSNLWMVVHGVRSVSCSSQSHVSGALLDASDGKEMNMYVSSYSGGVHEVLVHTLEQTDKSVNHLLAELGMAAPVVGSQLEMSILADTAGDTSCISSVDTSRVTAGDASCLTDASYLTEGDTTGFTEGDTTGLTDADTTGLTEGDTTGLSEGDMTGALESEGDTSVNTLDGTHWVCEDCQCENNVDESLVECLHCRKVRTDYETLSIQKITDDSLPKVCENIDDICRAEVLDKRNDNLHEDHDVNGNIVDSSSEMIEDMGENSENESLDKKNENLHKIEKTDEEMDKIDEEMEMKDGENEILPEQIGKIEKLKENASEDKGVQLTIEDNVVDLNVGEKDDSIEEARILEAHEEKVQNIIVVGEEILIAKRNQSTDLYARSTDESDIDSSYQKSYYPGDYTTSEVESSGILESSTDTCEVDTTGLTDYDTTGFEGGGEDISHLDISLSDSSQEVITVQEEIEISELISIEEIAKLDTGNKDDESENKPEANVDKVKKETEFDSDGMKPRSSLCEYMYPSVSGVSDTEYPSTLTDVSDFTCTTIDTSQTDDSIVVCEDCRQDFSSGLETTGCESEFSYHVCAECKSRRLSSTDGFGDNNGLTNIMKVERNQREAENARMIEVANEVFEDIIEVAQDVMEEDFEINSLAEESKDDVERKEDTMLTEKAFSYADIVKENKGDDVKTEEGSTDYVKSGEEKNTDVTEERREGSNAEKDEDKGKIDKEPEDGNDTDVEINSDEEIQDGMEKVYKSSYLKDITRTDSSDEEAKEAQESASEDFNTTIEHSVELLQSPSGTDVDGGFNVSLNEAGMGMMEDEKPFLGKENESKTLFGKIISMVIPDVENRLQRDPDNGSKEEVDVFETSVDPIECEEKDHAVGTEMDGINDEGKNEFELKPETADGVLNQGSYMASYAEILKMNDGKSTSSFSASAVVTENSTDAKPWSETLPEIQTRLKRVKEELDEMKEDLVRSESIEMKSDEEELGEDVFDSMAYGFKETDGNESCASESTNSNDNFEFDLNLAKSVMDELCEKVLTKIYAESPDTVNDLNKTDEESDEYFKSADEIEFEIDIAGTPMKCEQTDSSEKDLQHELSKIEEIFTPEDFLITSEVTEDIEIEIEQSLGVENVVNQDPVKEDNLKKVHENGVASPGSERSCDSDGLEFQDAATEKEAVKERGTADDSEESFHDAGEEQGKDA